MLIDDALFKSEFNKINGATINPVNYAYTAEFIDGNNNVIPIHNVLAIHNVAQYTTHISDNLIISLDVMKSIYLYLLTINRRLLKLRLVRKQNTVVGTPIATGASNTYNYNAYLTDNTSEAIETRIGKLDGHHTDDLGELVEIHVNLVEVGLSEFRLWDCGGVYKNITMAKLLQGLLSHPIKALGETNAISYNATIYPPDNITTRFQCLIPSGVRIQNLPNWLQKTWGVYSSGIGWYLTGGMWYVYPLYNVKRYANEVRRVTIINVPRNEMVGNTNSYVIIGNELYIYATGDTMHIDNVDRHMDISGSGFRTAKAGNVLDSFTVSTNGNTTIPPGQNSVAVSFDDRPGALNNLNTSKTLSSNLYDDASKIINGMGNIVILHWEYSNHHLLYPGMPVRLLYKVQDVPHSIYGILAAADTTIRTPQKSIIDNRYTSLTQMTLYTERATN